jgi:two-component system, LytTR family, response regulator
MMTCIAIDDEPKALEIIERYIAKSDLVDLKATFRDPVKASEFLSQEKVDLIFLDINMPDINGLKLIETLPVKPMVIFTTAYSNYAVESYELSAIDYLLKPITFERFLTAVNKASNQLSLQQKAVSRSEGGETLIIKSGPYTHQVRTADIFYLEKDGNYVTVHLKDKKILVRENMNGVFDLVPANEFVRVHKSFVVALKHITTIEVHQVIVNGTQIPIGSTYRESLRAKFGLK